MTEKFTKARAATENFIFFPKTADETRALQTALFGMGFVWGNDGTASSKYIDDSINHGLVLLDGKVYTRGEGDTRNYTTLPVSSVLQDYVPEERRYLQEQFDKINARIDRLSQRIETVSEKVDRVHDEMFPDVASTKPKLKPKPQA